MPTQNIILDDRFSRIVESENPSSIKKTTSYWIVAGGIIALFLLINLAVLSDFPAVWGDEVMQIDPAINFASGLGWSSRAWLSQSAHEFWASNNPLYPALLAIWIKSFGSSLIAVRSFNLFEFSVVTVIMLLLGQLVGVLRSISAMIAFITVLSCSGLMSFIYRSGRGDLTTMLVCSAVVWSYLYARATSRHAPLIASCFFVVASGIQALPFLFGLAATDCLIRRRFSKSLIVGIATICMGGLAVLTVMFTHNVLRAFIANTFASSHGLLGLFLQLLIFHDTKALKKFEQTLNVLSPKSIWHSMTADAVLATLMVVLVLLSLAAFSNRNFHLRSPLGIGLTFTTSIPLFMTATGHYPDYYHWMSVAPLAFCSVAAIEQTQRPSWLVSFSLLLLSAGSLLGLPLDIRRDLNDRRARDYSLIASYLQNNVRKGETIYADASAYYAAKALGYNMYTSSYGGGRGYPKVLEAESFSTLIIPQSDFTEITEKIGGTWKAIPEALDTCRAARPLTDIHGLRRCYEISIYRRVR